MPDNDFILISITLFAFFVMLIYMRLYWHYSYWQRKNIPFIRPTPLLGNLRNLIVLRTSFGDFFKSIHDAANAQQAPVVGMYLLHKPALLIRDPELIKTIFIKNSHLFLNRYEAADGLHDSMGYLTLPLAKYPVWRESRRRMTEFFTSRKLRERMYPLMLEVSLELEQHLAQRFKAQTVSEVIIEVKELCALYTTDVTALLAYSIRAESLKGNLLIHQALVDMLSPNFLKGFNFFVIFFLPHLTSLLRAKVFPQPYVKFIQKMLENTLKQRSNANADSDRFKDDLIDLLVNFQKQSILEQKHKFAEHPDFIASQVAIMLVAGFETSSSLIAFLLYEIAKQPTIQQRLRSEIKQHLQHDEQGGTLKYEDLLGMSYLNMVVAEGLRMYPTASFINREFTPETNDSCFSLKPLVDFELMRGAPVYVSILGIHHDEKYWPNSHIFDPERFHPERIGFIHPMTYIPFGVGPHGCIGSRLGVIQVKLGLVHILKNYTIECCHSTPTKIVFEPKSFMLQNKGGIELKFIRDCNA